MITSENIRKSIAHLKSNPWFCPCAGCEWMRKNDIYPEQCLKFLEYMLVRSEYKAPRRKRRPVKRLRPARFAFPCRPATDMPRINLHLAEEDCAVPSTWWAQAKIIKNSVRSSL